MNVKIGFESGSRHTSAKSGAGRRVWLTARCSTCGISGSAKRKHRSIILQVQIISNEENIENRRNKNKKKKTNVPLTNWTNGLCTMK